MNRTVPTWPGINPEFISDEEEDEFLKPDEIAENPPAKSSKSKSNSDEAAQSKSEKKQQLTMEAFSNLAPRSKQAEGRKVRTLSDDPRNKPAKHAPPIGKKKTSRNKSENPPNPVQVRKMFHLFTQERTTENSKGVIIPWPPEPFIISHGELFCQCCREPITEKKTTIYNHIGCKKHRDSKAEFQKAGLKRQQILDSIVEFQEATGVVGIKTLSEEERIFRYDVVFSFLSSLDPLLSINHHRKLLTKHKMRLSDATHMSDLIPLINRNENELLREEFKGCKVCVIFDGAAHKGEAFAVVLRTVKDWKIQQRLVKVSLLAGSLKGRNICAELTMVLQVCIGLAYTDVLCFSHDRASPNLNAIKLLTPIYDTSFGMSCVSHTTDHVGDHFEVSRLSHFFQPLNQLLSMSTKALGLFERECGATYPGVSTNRWWSTYECYTFLYVHAEGRDSFVRQGINEEFVGSALMTKLFNIVYGNEDNGKAFSRFSLELAAIVEFARPFVQTTYYLEGDGCVVLYTHDCLMYCNTFIQAPNKALSDACIEALVSDIDDELRKQSKRVYYQDYRDKLSSKAIEYFVANLMGGDVGKNLDLFKFARLGNPAFVKTLVETSGMDALIALVRELTEVTQLQQFHPLLDQLMSELPAYVHTAAQHAGDWNFHPFPQPSTLEEVKVCKHVQHEKVGLDILSFWERFQPLGLPTWGALVMHIISLAPSSAAVERVFSLFRNKFDKQMFNSKEDYIETSLMLHFNQRSIPP